MNRMRCGHVMCRLLIVLSTVPVFWSGMAPVVSAVEGPPGHDPRSYSEEAVVPMGVIGVSLHVAAERVGDPALLYVGHVHPDGPAQRAGLGHGEEIITVDGASVSGKSHEQIVRMVRGAVGTTVKLGVKGDKGMREISITRVASETLSKVKMGTHGGTER